MSIAAVSHGVARVEQRSSNENPLLSPAWDRLYSLYAGSIRTESATHCGDNGVEYHTRYIYSIPKEEISRRAKEILQDPSALDDIPLTKAESLIDEFGTHLSLTVFEALGRTQAFQGAVGQDWHNTALQKWRNLISFEDPTRLPLFLERTCFLERCSLQEFINYLIVADDFFMCLEHPKFLLLSLNDFGDLFVRMTDSYFHGKQNTNVQIFKRLLADPRFEKIELHYLNSALQSMLADGKAELDDEVMCQITRELITHPRFLQMQSKRIDMDSLTISCRRQKFAEKFLSRELLDEMPLFCLEELLKGAAKYKNARVIETISQSQIGIREISPQIFGEVLLLAVTLTAEEERVIFANRDSEEHQQWVRALNRLIEIPLLEHIPFGQITQCLMALSCCHADPLVVRTESFARLLQKFSFKATPAELGQLLIQLCRGHCSAFIPILLKAPASNAISPKDLLSAISMIKEFFSFRSDREKFMALVKAHPNYSCCGKCTMM